MRKLFVAVLAACACLVSLPSVADSVTNSLADWGSSIHGTFDSAYYWVPVGSEGDTSLKDESKKTQSLDPSIDYVVNNRTVYTPKDTDRGIVTFNGRSLTIGQGRDGYMRIYSYKNAVVVFDEPGLFLNRGICYTQAGNNYAFNLDGVLTVNASAASPFRFMPSYVGNTLNIFSVVHGGSGTGVQLDDNKLGPFAVRFLNPLSDYAGSIDVKPASSGTPGGAPQLTLELAELSVGPVSVGSLSAICPASHTDVATVSQLTLAENSVIGVKVGFGIADNQVTGSAGCLTVTESLVLPLSGKVYVRAPAQPTIPDGKTERIVVLKAPFGSIDKAKFELVSEVGMFSIPCELDVTSDPTAGDELAIVSGLVVLQTVSDQNNNSANLNGSTTVYAPNSITNEQHWSDGQVPHEGAAYLVNKINGAATCLRTSFDGPRDVEFYGDSLTIGEDCRLWLFNDSKFTVKSLTALNNSIIGQGQWRSGTRICGGIVNLPSGTVEFSTIDTHQFYIDSELYGAAELLFKGPGSSSPQANYHFTASNPSFKGTVLVRSAASADDQGGKERNQKLHVYYADSLGGPLDAFNPKAWTFQDLGELIPENSMVFSDLTRGFYYGNRSRLTVAAGKEVDFLAQRTFDGELFVRGGGVVGLGGTVKFGAEFADEPTEGKNLLTFHAGDLKALSAGCVDGLVVTFADAASKVIVPVDTTDAALLAGGIRNVKTATPFVFPGEKLKVEIGLAGATPVAERWRTVGLFTVSEDAAASLRDKIDVTVPKSTFGHKATVKIVETADANAKTVTFAAECSVGGVMLIVR